MKKTISSLLAVSVVVASMPAFALTMDEMKQPGSAVSWYQNDADMKELDVADYLFSIHAKKEVSEAKIKQVHECMDSEMKSSYSSAKETDSNAPSLLRLLQKCKA